jgi:hypothetical protein
VEARHSAAVWLIRQVTPLRKPDVSGATVLLDVAHIKRSALEPGIVIHSASRMLPADVLGPPRVQQTHGKTMRASWRDPDDFRPNARKGREISGWIAFDPLRLLARDPSSGVTDDHIRAADYLRLQAEIAMLGMAARDNILPIGAIVHLPKLGPAPAAVRSARASSELIRVIRRFSTEAWLMVQVIVLWNRTLTQWCHDRERSIQTETGRLLAALDLLAEHFGTEIEKARADIPAHAA